MKVFLDAHRAVPDGWLAVHRPDDAILLLATGEVTDLSLDHENENGLRGAADEVLDWIAVAVTKHGFKVPLITVHSLNAARRQRLQVRVDEIEKLVPAKVKPPRTETTAKIIKTAASAIPGDEHGNAKPADPRLSGLFRGHTNGKSEEELAPTGVVLTIPDADSVCAAYRAAADSLCAQFTADYSDERLTERRSHIAWNERMFRRYWFYRLGTNYGDAIASRMNDGFRHGPGWRPLLERLSDKLLALLGSAETAPVYLEVLQVKEKLGGLRFYYRLHNRSADVEAYRQAAKEICVAVDDACAVSLMVCEQCGQPGALRHNRRVITLCDACHKDS